MMIGILNITLLLLLTYYGFVHWYFSTIVLLIIYWLPKFIFIKLLNTLYPDIVTNLDEYYGICDCNVCKTHDTNTYKIALTFDDSPYGSHEQIIDMLDRYNMKGTFFVISGDINESNEHIFVEAVRNGHTLGNHGKTNSMHALKSMTDLKQEINHCDNTIKEIYRKANVELEHQLYYRPGSGIFHNKMLEYIESINYQLALGSVYPFDPAVPSSTINYYYLINHIEPNDVVVLHDRSWTVPLLEKLLPWMIQNNYISVALE